MKSTGIVRRIDDLGRVVIPRELRRTLRIREGDPLELYIDKDMVCFKKYSILGKLTDEANRIIKSYKSGELIITDLNYILASHTNKNVGKELPIDYVEAMYDRDKKATELCIGISEPNIYKVFIVPILSMGEVVGSVGAINYNNDINIDTLTFIANFIGQNCEE